VSLFPYTTTHPITDSYQTTIPNKRIIQGGSLVQETRVSKDTKSKLQVLEAQKPQQDEPRQLTPEEQLTNLCRVLKATGILT
jgi:hypothetical protein